MASPPSAIISAASFLLSQAHLRERERERERERKCFLVQQFRSIVIDLINFSFHFCFKKVSS